MLRKLSLCLLPFVLLAQTKDTGGAPAKPGAADLGSIEGRILNAKTGEPLRAATFRVWSVDSAARTEPEPVTTDEQGKFLMKGLAPGRYRLVALSKWSAMEYGARRPGGQGPPYLIGAGQHLQDIVFRLPPASVISGKILDEAGEPVERALVQTESLRFVDGKKQLVTGVSVRTNDLGEFRLTTLPAGKYLVIAGYYETEIEKTDKGTIIRAGMAKKFVPTYYPGVPDQASAAFVDLPAGGEAGGITFKLLKKPTFAVKGHVRQDVSPANRMITLSLVVSGLYLGNALARVSTANVDGSGDFEFRGVIPGSYTLAATVGGGGCCQAWLHVDVFDEDVGGLGLHIGPPAKLAGKVRIKGDAARSLAGITLTLMPRSDAFPPLRPRAKVSEDGSFQFDAVSADKFDVEVYGLLEGFYVESIRSGDQDVLDQGLNCIGTPAPLDVLLNPSGAILTGAVQDDKEQQPVTGATVVVVPQEELRRGRVMYYRTAVTDQLGNFTVEGIIPGKYKVFAWDDLEPDAYMDPEFIKAVESKGVPKEVKEGTQYAVTLTAIRASDAR